MYYEMVVFTVNKYVSNKKPYRRTKEKIYKD